MIKTVFALTYANFARSKTKRIFCVIVSSTKKIDKNRSDMYDKGR